MKILYYDCFSGISGDMHLGAMIDLGVDMEYLVSELKKLKLSGYSIRAEKDQRNGITGTRVDVTVEGENNHRHTISVVHRHEHRNLEEILNLISASRLSGAVKERSRKMFTLLAEAEARVHNTSVEQVHFHEVGAVDSIIDIVGAAICIENINPDRIMASAVELGGGFARCEHGKLPVPAPATVELLKGIPVSSGAVREETTTPTGAVILSANVDEFTPLKNFRILKTAYGIGQRKTDIPNVLRLYMGDTELKSLSDGQDTSHAIMIECNIDDMNPEIYGYIMEQLFASGADDVFLTPITMKKIRPASKLSVLCREELERAMTDIILTQTTTLGVRTYPVEKTMLKREFTTIDTRFGKVTIKSAIYKGTTIRSKPEYEDCIRIAREFRIPVQQVYQEIYKLIGD
jgi:uncharacterized protein (TIGR00299 family) protein